MEATTTALEARPVLRMERCVDVTRYGTIRIFQWRVPETKDVNRVLVRKQERTCDSWPK